MDAAYFFFLYLVSLAFAYELRFTEATLHFGRSISKIQEGRGFQDAVTPPFSTNLAIVTYISVALALGFGFYLYGIWLGLAVVAPFYVVVLINRLVLIPKPESSHFRNLILNDEPICELRERRGPTTRKHDGRASGIRGGAN
jgi:hypothetical protein